MNSTFTCPVQGHPDLYGLGIRIALYLQIFTAQISGLASSVLSVDRKLGPMVLVFVISTSAVLLRLILHRKIEAVEIFPILSLLIFQMGACRVPFWQEPWTIIIYLCVFGCLFALTNWFWFRGMDILPRSCADDHAFFFATVSMWHWFRKFSQAASVIITIGGALGIFVYIFSEFIGLYYS